MSAALSWILVAVVVGLLLVLVLGVLLWKSKKYRAGQGPDYRAFFLMGLSWLCMGLPLMFIYNEFFNALAAMGAIFTIMGAVNYKKWKKKPLTKKQKISWITVFVIMIVLVTFVLYVKAFF